LDPVASAPAASAVSASGPLRGIPRPPECRARPLESMRGQEASIVRQACPAPQVHSSPMPPLPTRVPLKRTMWPSCALSSQLRPCVWAPPLRAERLCCQLDEFASTLNSASCISSCVVHRVGIPRGTCATRGEVAMCGRLAGAPRTSMSGPSPPRHGVSGGQQPHITKTRDKGHTSHALKLVQNTKRLWTNLRACKSHACTCTCSCRLQPYGLLQYMGGLRRGVGPPRGSAPMG
jgi:hypothetical protein